MSQSYTSIQQIFDTILKTTTGLPTFTQENIKSQVTATKPWCRSTLLPAQTQVIGIGQVGLRMDQGLYQVDLFYPQNSGNIDAATMADLIMSKYKRGTYYTGGSTKVLVDKVYRLPSSSLTQATFYHLPIVVSWQYYDNA
jgi:hypothetical protein